MHAEKTRMRSESSNGTSNLKNTAERCDADRGVFTTAEPMSAIPSFTLVYEIAVEMLRPGTHIPDPTTIPRDANHLYLDLSDLGKLYFEVCCPMFR
jgi:hypothetical protein